MRSCLPPVFAEHLTNHFPATLALSTDPMNNRWYYRSSETEVGPITFSGLRRMALEGLISQETLVRAGDEGEWISAGTVEQLFLPKRERTIGPSA